MCDPRSYKEANSVQHREVEAILQAYPAVWRDHAKIIDIGCGDGSVTMRIWKKYLPESWKEIVGSDKSQECVDFANERYGGGGVEFIRLDIDAELPGELRGRFDHVVSSFALHWVHRQEVAFSNMFDLLAAGGSCLLMFLGHVDVFDYYRRLARSPRWSAALQDLEDIFVSPYHDSQDPKTEITSLMKKIGFRDIDVQVHTNKINYVGGVEEFRTLMKTLNPFPGLAGEWDAFMDDYVALNPGAGAVEHQLLVVAGRK